MGNMQIPAVAYTRTVDTATKSSIVTGWSYRVVGIFF